MIWQSAEPVRVTVAGACWEPAGMALRPRTSPPAASAAPAREMTPRVDMVVSWFLPARPQTVLRILRQRKGFDLVHPGWERRPPGDGTVADEGPTIRTGRSCSGGEGRPSTGGRGGTSEPTGGTVTDTATPAHLDPRLEAFMAATERLTGPGAPFEVVTEDVLGEQMSVFEHRPRSLREVLAASFAHGDRLAMAFSDGREISFDDLSRQVPSVAAYLRDVHGVGPGDNVALCGANSAGWILSFWACLSIGAVAVAMNGWWTETEMRHALELTEPKV